jgi:hypothetical protein
MKNEFIPYELALELKQLGFDEPCFAWYGNGKLHSDIDLSMTDSLYCQKDMEPSNECTAPTFSQAFRWFREKHGLYSLLFIVRPFNATEEEYPEEVWIGKICQSDRKQLVNTDNGLAINHFHTYEEAELACLKKLIETIK